MFLQSETSTVDMRIYCPQRAEASFSSHSCQRSMITIKSIVEELNYWFYQIYYSIIKSEAP